MVLAVVSEVGLAVRLSWDAPGEGARGWPAPGQDCGTDPAQGCQGQRENHPLPLPFRFLWQAKCLTNQIIWRK